MSQHRRFPSQSKAYRREYYRRYRRTHREEIKRINRRNYQLHSKRANRDVRRKSRRKWNSSHPEKQRLYAKRSLFKHFVLNEATPEQTASLRATYRELEEDFRQHGHFTVTPLILRQHATFPSNYRVNFIYDVVPNEPPASQKADLARIKHWLGTAIADR